MCGRFACFLGKCNFQKACCYLDSGGNVVLPKFSSKEDYYVPKYNMAPTSTTPVVVSPNKLSNCDFENGERVLCDMRWGMIPPWKRNDRDLIINNCRGEGIMEKPLFKKPFTDGQRCVVPVNGFYEWQTKSEFKQPYFIHAPSESNVQWLDLENEQDLLQYYNTKVGWTGPKLLNMAAIFTENGPNAETNMNYSYSIVTIESQKPFSAIHNRVPVILDTDAKIEEWLTTDSTQKALSLIQAPQNIEWYMVSNYVGNSRNQGHSCLQRTTEAVKPPGKRKTPKKGPIPGQRSITSFFQKSPAKDGVSSAKDGVSSAKDGVSSAKDGVSSAKDGVSSAQVKKFKNN